MGSKELVPSMSRHFPSMAGHFGAFAGPSGNRGPIGVRKSRAKKFRSAWGFVATQRFRVSA